MFLLFFQIAISSLACVATFTGQLYFWRGYFFTLFQSDYFDTAVTFSEQIFFQSSCCFLLFQNSHFSQQLFFQKSFFFRTQILQSSHFLRKRSSLWQLFFGTAVFPCLGWNYLKITTFSRQLLLHSTNFFRKATFWKNIIFEKSNIPHNLLFLESFFFRAATFSKDGTVYSSYLFRRATFTKHTFSEEVLFYSWASFPRLYFLFIR